VSKIQKGGSIGLLLKPLAKMVMGGLLRTIVSNTFWDNLS